MVALLLAAQYARTRKVATADERTRAHRRFTLISGGGCCDGCWAACRGDRSRAHDHGVRPGDVRSPPGRVVRTARNPIPDQLRLFEASASGRAVSGSGILTDQLL